jgi:hypothetical protein
MEEEAWPAQKGDGHLNPGQIRVGQPSITSPSSSKLL